VPDEPCPSLPTPVVLPDAATALQPSFAELDALLTAQTREGKVPAFISVVVYDQQLLWSKGYGLQNFTDPSSPPPSADSIIRIASLTKLMTTELLLSMVADGIVDMESPIDKVLPGFSMRILPNQYFKNARPITLRALASHLGGLPREQPCAWGTCSEAEVLAALSEMYAIMPPDSVPHYSNLGFSLLGRGLEHAYAAATGAGKAGPSYEKLVEQRVWQPIGMSSSSFALNDTSLKRLAVGQADVGGGAAPLEDLTWDNPCGGAFVSGRDMARWMFFLFRSTELPTGSPAVAATGAPLDSSQNAFFQGATSVLPDGSSGFGLTWELNYSSVIPAWVYSKAGQLQGYRSQIALVPELKLGVFHIAMQSEVEDETVWSMSAIEMIAPALRDLLQQRAVPPVMPPNAARFVADFDGGVSVWVDGSGADQRLLIGPTPADRAVLVASRDRSRAGRKEHSLHGSGCQSSAIWPGDILWVHSVVDGASSSPALLTTTQNMGGDACRWLDDSSNGEIAYLRMDSATGKPSQMLFMGQRFCAK